MAINIQVWVLVEISKLYTDYTHIQFHDVYFFLTYLVWDIGSQELIAKYSEILWSPGNLVIRKSRPATVGLFIP